MIALSDYGYTAFFERQAEGSGLLPARITAAHKERYEIVCAHGVQHARLKAGVYYGGGEEVFPTTGDFVLIQYNESGDSQICRTLARKAFFSRRDPTRGRGEQAVAANFDAVFILMSLNHDFNVNRAVRYLTLAWQSGGLPVIVLTKRDLCEDYAGQIAALRPAAATVETIAVSAKTGEGLSELAPYLGRGRTIVLLGSSGVGKSSLVNALAGEDCMAVSEIREDDSRGRHTTTHRQLIRLKDGTLVIDTPGMRELGMWRADEGLPGAFSDVEAYLGRCRFSDCRHDVEPGCAIRAAVASGELPLARWQAYQKLRTEADAAGDMAARMAAKRAWQKSITQHNKQAKKSGELRQ